MLREGEAVLARNVMDDSHLGSRDSKGEILATSVICAPVRMQGSAAAAARRQSLGVIHLYSTDADRPLDPDDLEFTLAVADTVAVALDNLSRRQELAENLTPDSARERPASRAAWRRRARSSAAVRVMMQASPRRSPGRRRAGRPC